MAAPQNQAVQQQAPPPVVKSLSIEGALSLVERTAPEAYAILAAMYRKDIVSLGTDDAFALRDSEGEIRAFKQSLTLTSKNGALIQPTGDSGPWVVSAQGYEIWQEAAGACVIFPSEVLVDGKWQQNPAVIRDTKNGRILMIYARAVAFRFSSKGIPMVSDWTTIYDTPSYRMIDLLGKAKKFPQAFRLLPIDMEPEETDGKKQTWAKYPFDEATVVWMNTSHDEALTWLGSIINREKKSIDFAQTFAKRNALKHLSGIQKAPGPQWTIPVISWRPISGNIIKWDATQYANLQARVGKMISGDRSEFAGVKEIEMKTGAERVTDEGVDAAMQEENQVDPEDQTAIDITPEKVTEKTEPEKPAEGPNQEKKNRNDKKEEPTAAMKNLIVAKKEFHEEFLAACQSLGIEPDSDIRNGQAVAIMNQISRIVDAKNS